MRPRLIAACAKITMQPDQTIAPVASKKTGRWFSRPGIWFFSVLALGAAARLYLLTFTEGTYDVILWEEHARRVARLGVIGDYHDDELMNHPPFISKVAPLALRVSQNTGIPFRVLWRVPFTVLDAGIVLLLLSLLRTSEWRFLVGAGYWINPLAIIFSGYHGNTDSAVGFFLLLSVWLLARRKTIGAGAAMGASFAIKIPGLLAMPALVLFIKGWRRWLTKA